MNQKTYTEQAISRAFDQTGAFFAFGQDQFDEAKKEGVVYVSLGAGLLCPKSNADQLIKSLKMIKKRSVQKDLKENGIDAIIKRELINHEAFYTGDLEDTLQALSPYLVTREQVAAIYQQERNNFDY